MAHQITQTLNIALACISAAIVLCHTKVLAFAEIAFPDAIGDIQVTDKSFLLTPLDITAATVSANDDKLVFTILLSGVPSNPSARYHIPIRVVSSDAPLSTSNPFDLPMGLADGANYWIAVEGANERSVWGYDGIEWLPLGGDALKTTHQFSFDPPDQVTLTITTLWEEIGLEHGQVFAFDIFSTIQSGNPAMPYGPADAISSAAPTISSWTGFYLTAPGAELTYQIPPARSTWYFAGTVSEVSNTYSQPIYDRRFQLGMYKVGNRVSGSITFRRLDTGLDYQTPGNPDPDQPDNPNVGLYYQVVESIDFQISTAAWPGEAIAFIAPPPDPDNPSGSWRMGSATIENNVDLGAGLMMDNISMVGPSYHDRVELDPNTFEETITKLSGWEHGYPKFRGLGTSRHELDLAKIPCKSFVCVGYPLASG